MAESTFSDILSVNVDSNETRFYNLSAAETLTVGPNNEISFNANQSTIPGTLNTTASYAITASYAMNGGGGSTDTGSLLTTASFVNPDIRFTKGDGTLFSVDISSLSVSTASYARTASYSKTLGASLINDESGGNARLALVSSDGTYISTISYLTSSLALTASSAISSSYASNGGVTQIVAGTNITISPTNGLGAVTINSTGGGGSGAGANITASFTNQSTWTFVHALGNRGVVVQTFDTSWNQTIPQSITLTDDNTATIVFPSNQSGYAIASLGGVVSTAATASYVLNAVSASYASQALSSSFATSASFASTASFVTNLNQAVTIGNITSTPSTENTLNVYPSPDGGTGEGGQILLAASGGLYSSASMLDTYQDQFRILKGTNTGGSTAAQFIVNLHTGDVTASGAFKPSAWSAGQVIKDTMLSNTEVTVSTTTIATSTSDTDFVTYNYTPVSSNSYLIIHYHLSNFDFSSGTGNDSYISRIKVDGAEITYSTQSTVNGNRSPVLFPLTGRYTNSSTAAKSIVVACRRNSADDSITITNSATSMWLRITEIAR